ncbi:alanyl-tRNA synthetase [gamma proteobacterium HTCC5015]|nr:alanyl-tRNA synthetase [gamma proteobacterium HTCC5015]
MTSSANIRKQFLDYFASKGHAVVPSSSLVPAGDDTLLFTNAGMVPFKHVFLGQEQRDYNRATSSQRCVRAGGKHNDLENVGYTARHHTFFEMLGNFSFGDYFKRDAIHYGWEFLTQVVGLPKEKLWVTVFEEDDEAADIWLKEIGVDPDRLSRIGAKDNFWQMGDTGPCGPCTEIFYDHGEHIWGGPPGTPEEDGDRYIEVWNLVFMQYNRSQDGTLTPLPKPSVDTGMGLERLAAILQGVHSNYEIDLFQALIHAAGKAVGVEKPSHEISSLNVIADHIRSCAFLVVDGVLPSNEGRGYVLRRIIRRACRHGYKLGQNQPFFYTLVEELVAQMGEAYPELSESQARVEQVLKKEEERFAETLSQGMGILNQAIDSLDGERIPGETVFQLYDTYGFPVDLTADIAREHELDIDLEGYEACMEEQRQRARAASQFGADLSERIEFSEESEFTGYEHLNHEAVISHLIVDGSEVERIAEGQQGMVVLNSTPFYAESGGQVGDRGVLVSEGVRFRVDDTQKQGGAIVHIGHLECGELSLNDNILAEVDMAKRRATELNHSATHLMHWALREVLGDHVQQKGSLVNEEYLRFDFSHFQPMTDSELAQVEDLVNAEILKNRATQTRLMTMEDAKAAGAMALFGEKYGDEVRVLNIGDHSIELCGGTHVDRTGDIGLFKLIGEGGVASGVRRVEAITGIAAQQWVRQTDDTVRQLAARLRTDRGSVADKVEQLADKNRQLEKELERLKSKLASQAGGDIASQAVEIDGIKVLATALEGADTKVLRSTLDQLKDKLGAAAIVLGAADGDKVRLVAGVTKSETSRIKAGELVNHVAVQVGGRGGGRPDMAQAGGSDPAALEGALASVETWVREQLS